jgi:hypothetical protein
VCTVWPGQQTTGMSPDLKTSLGNLSKIQLPAFVFSSNYFILLLTLKSRKIFFVYFSWNAPSLALDFFGLTNPNFSEAATSVSQIWNEKRKPEKASFL